MRVFLADRKEKKLQKASQNTYETYYILKPGMTEADLTAIHDKVDTVISKFQGKLVNRDNWGVRELAYPIEKQTNGNVSIAVYTGNAGVVEEIERHFRILDDVMRFLTVRVPADYDYEKVKKQITQSEEEVKHAREQRKKGEGGFGGGFGGGGRGDGGGRPQREYRE